MQRQHKHMSFNIQHKVVGLVLGLLFPVSMAWGQTMEEADKEYKALLEMQNQMASDTTVTQERFLEAALACSQTFVTVLKSLPSGVEDYATAKNILLSVCPLVKSGAGYFSQAQKDDLAVEYAQAAVEISMMSEMRDQELRKTPDYPSLVYFVASHKFNARQFEPAAKYLQEYLDVTDVTEHAKVVPFLRAAKNQISKQQKEEGVFHDVNKGVPDFDIFARESIRQSMDKWKVKDPYETLSEYKERVNEETARAKQRELQNILMEEYVQRLSYKMSVTDMELKPYDADHESFLISSPYGDIVLTVPRTGNEARDFASTWKDVKVSDQRFVIANKKLALAGVTFATPDGKTYVYSNQQALTYNDTRVDANFEEDLVDYGKLVNSDGSKNKTTISKQEVVIGVSDVDVNIPVNRRANENTFAVIIANENYTLVPTVPMAGNDGRVFAEYCEKTLGLPKENIMTYHDATYGKMLRAMKDIKNVAAAFPDIHVIFYYAGHGVPNEATHDAFLLPIDADGKQTEVCYPLKKLYTELSTLGTQSVVVFLDACFSGATGDGKSLMASARGVEIETNEEEVLGNMIIFSATTSGQTAYPYKEHGHGLFTYFLLKKLQESKGNTTLGELGSYITKNVQQRSVLINQKIQTPTVTPSSGMLERWQKMKLR